MADGMNLEGGPNDSIENPPVITGASISPSSATLGGAGTQQYTPTVLPSNVSQLGTWATTLGTISGSGLLTAPASSSIAQTGTVTFTAADGITTATASFTVSATGSGTISYVYVRGPYQIGLVSPGQYGTYTEQLGIGNLGFIGLRLTTGGGANPSPFSLTNCTAVGNTYVNGLPVTVDQACTIPYGNGDNTVLYPIQSADTASQVFSGALYIEVTPPDGYPMTFGPFAFLVGPG